VRDALRRQLIFHAFEFALPAPKTESLLTRWHDLLLEGLERVFCSRAGVDHWYCHSIACWPLWRRWSKALAPIRQTKR
jgi:hypothetical protein